MDYTADTHALQIDGQVPLSDAVAITAIEHGSRRDWTTTARLADQPQGDSFQLTTGGPRTLGRLAIGADLVGASNMAVSVRYAPELGRDFTSHSGNATLTIAF